MYNIDSICTGQVKPETFFSKFSNSTGDKLSLAECSLYIVFLHVYTETLFLMCSLVALLYTFSAVPTQGVVDIAWRAY